MPSGEWSYWAAALLAYLLTAVSQLMLKAAARRSTGPLNLRVWLNPLVLTAYGLFLLVTLMSLYALRIVPLRATLVLAPMTLLLVAGASRILFDERLSRRQLLGICLIAGGILLFNAAGIH